MIYFSYCTHVLCSVYFGIKHLFTCCSLTVGILISSASQPVLRKNKIFGGKAAGIEVTNGGGGVIEENEVFDNYFDGICLATGVNPTLKGVCVCGRGRVLETGREKGSQVKAAYH